MGIDPEAPMNSLSGFAARKMSRPFGVEFIRILRSRSEVGSQLSISDWHLSIAEPPNQEQ
jgi:hypothetical protein